MRQAQILLGRVGFDPGTVPTMSLAELSSHITNLTPASAAEPSNSSDSTRIVNQSRLRRKQQRLSGK